MRSAQRSSTRAVRRRLPAHDGRKLRRLYARMDRAAAAAAQAGRLGLRLLRLALEPGHRHDAQGLFPAAEPHHLAAGKGPRRAAQLEKRHGGHLVRHPHGRLHVPCRRREGAPPRARALPRRRPAEGLGGDAGRQIPQHVPVKLLGRYLRALLVHAGKHRPPDAKARKAAGQAHPRKLRPRRHRARPLRRLRLYGRDGKEARPPLRRHRAQRAVLRLGRKAAGAGGDKPRHPGLRRRRVLGAQRRPPAALSELHMPRRPADAVAGFDIEKLVAGATAMEKLCGKDVPFAENPAAIYAATRNELYKHDKKIEILVNFNPKLHYVSEWWKQLYGESEGKENKGIFPAAVDFSTDLHSMGQWIQEGERTIYETVISVEKTNHKLEVPSDAQNLDGLNFLAGKRVDEVNKMAELGTQLAHVDGGVPNIRIVIPALNEESIGGLLYFFEKACGISGYLLGVNPFNQPGVEAYKKNMFALLNKPGYEEESKAIRARL